MSVEANPLAVQKLREKTPVGRVLKSADWSKVSLGLRETAFFSATVENMRFLDRAQQRIDSAISMSRRPEGAYQTREKFIAEMQKLAMEEGLVPRDPSLVDTLQDPSSERRLKLIYDTQTKRAAEYAQWKAEQDPDVLDAYPAQELIRIESRTTPRQDWPERFEAAGGELVGGRMVARKDSPVWSKMSRFGTPWPPFDFGSGMGLRDISRREAERLGVIAQDEQIEPAQKEFTENLEASVTDLSPRYQGALETIFGDQVSIKNGMAQWKSLVADLTEAESAAVASYTEIGGGARTNEILRQTEGEPEDEAIRAEIEALDAAVGRLPVRPGETYRGLDADAAEVWRNAAPGDVILDHGYTSTTMSQARAGAYGDTQLIVRGGSGRDIRMWSVTPQELEVIYPRGTQWRVVETRPDGAIVIEEKN